MQSRYVSTPSTYCVLLQSLTELLFKNWRNAPVSEIHDKQICSTTFMILATAHLRCRTRAYCYYSYKEKFLLAT